MWRDKRNIQIAIGLVTFGLAMATNALPYYWHQYMDPMRQVQVVGTLALLFGELRAHPAHRPKLLLVWLATTVFCCLSIAYAGLMILVKHGCFTGIFFPWTMTAIIAYMLDYMYRQYVTLALGGEDAAPAAAETTAAKDETNQLQSQTKQFSYRTENPTILVHGKSIQLP
ncbi:hypothetical protein KR222_001564 [Zaprionus bogoriensis]|nr:hypothetical protein KR222_001564 [Zaprionus bogoriensis]